MAGSGKSTSIVSSFSTLLMEAWQKWDVRGMVLFSLTLQIVLSVLGRRRKYKINPFFKTILWFAYLGADWIAIASLGKLSGSYTESPATNVLRAYWAPLLLLHLGGPDTITAYAFEDNKLWIRHLLILVVKAIFVIYVVCLSWTFSWLSFLSLPLILAGIIKYVEKIWCLQLNNSQEKKPVISNVFNPRGHDPRPIENEALDRLLDEHSNVLQGYLLFILMRPDVNDYLSSHSISDAGIRMKAYLEETTGIDGRSAFELLSKYVFRDRNTEDFFGVLSVELGFMFDVVYTKAALIYTKLGCLLRLPSFASSFSVLLLFFINIINEPNFNFSRIDIAITGILLSGAIALELYATWLMLSSDWAVLVTEFHHSMLVRKIFKAALKCFPLLLSQSKRWSNQMGQFDLLEYCWRYKKRKANQSYGILRKITNCNEIVEMWHKYWFIKFVNISDDMQQTLLIPIGAILTRIIKEKSMKLSRGEEALQRGPQFEQLKWSIELDFDHSIIIWHLATSVCYLQEDHHDEIMEISRYVSNYMMYLLAMFPALLLPEQSKSFWLDHTYDKLKELLFSTTDPRNAASTLVPDHVQEEELEFSCHEHEEEHEEELEFRSRETTLKDILPKHVSELAGLLKKLENKWEVITDVWIEMLVYAALSSQHISHVKQLGEGIEFLSFIWLSIGPGYIGSHLNE